MLKTHTDKWVEVITGITTRTPISGKYE
ncbi:hypothetical protein [Bacillus cereus group sp. RP32]